MSRMTGGHLTPPRSCWQRQSQKAPPRRTTTAPSRLFLLLSSLRPRSATPLLSHLSRLVFLQFPRLPSLAGRPGGPTSCGIPTPPFSRTLIGTTHVTSRLRFSCSLLVFWLPRPPTRS